MQFTIFTANSKGKSNNAYYPNKQVINNEEDFKKAVSYDHVCAEYKNSHRSISDFLEADCSPFDNDNSHSDDPKDWISPEQYEDMFPDVAYVVVPSKSDMKDKGSRSARPRHHIYFPHKTITDSDEYKKLKESVVQQFPFFDDNAKDAARFLYGNEAEGIIWHEGSKDITEVIGDDGGSAFAQWDERNTGIQEGTRNSTMSRYAGKIIKRLGNTDEAHQQFLKEAEKCNPPLDDDELEKIWNSAVKFGAKVAAQAGYIPPEKYNSGGFSLMPTDFSDVGQATVLTTEYKDRLRYSPSTDYLVYNGSFWEESQPAAQGLAQELTERQLRDARAVEKKAHEEMQKNGAAEVLAAFGANKAETMLNNEQRKSAELYQKAKEYRKYAIKRRDTKYITAALKESRPMVVIDQKKLDAGEYLLNMPSGTWNLDTCRMQEHKFDDYITKETAVDPSNKGMDIWEDALHTFFGDDKELIDYVQDTAGLAAIGKVEEEALIIAYGEGRNGKSTFWNTIARVLGSYSGNMSADTLTVGCKRNVKPELAEVKGKRLIIAAELEEGMRLNTSTVKQLCSTDEIFAEKKYKAPFSFTPTHSVVLYTNHLPKVGAIDEGTWRRLIVIPFNAKIEGSSDIKNYSDYLFSKAGGAVMKWILIGAKRAIEQGCDLTKPAVVQEAIEKYKAENNWIQHFIDDCCEVDETYKEKSGDVYISYRNYCVRTGEYIRSTSDFYTALESLGFDRHKTKKGILVVGLRLKSDFLAD